MKRIAFVFLLQMFVLVPSANSEDVVITMTGTLDTIFATDQNNAPDSAGYQSILPFSSGAPVTATYRYNLDAPDVNNSDSFGRYLTGGESSLVVGGTTFEFPSFIDLGNDTPEDFFWARIMLSEGEVYNASGWNYDPAGITQVVHRVELSDSTGSVFDSDELPSNPFSETDFDSLTWRISTFGQTGSETITTPLGSHTGRTHRFTGTINAVSFEIVPEPSVIPLLLISWLLSPSRRVRRKLN